jgi:hypothetical protein
MDKNLYEMVYLEWLRRFIHFRTGDPQCIQCLLMIISDNATCKFKIKMSDSLNSGHQFSSSSELCIAIALARIFQSQFDPRFFACASACATSYIACKQSKNISETFSNSLVLCMH